MGIRQKITPFLWFDHEAEEAASFYTSLFPDSKILSVSRHPEGSPGKPGSVMVVEFLLAGQRFVGLNGGPHFKFTEAFSLVIDCDSQAEVDAFWEKLTAGGGQESQCGWLKDRYGLSWQVVPSAAIDLFRDPDPARSKRVWGALMQMRKIDVAALQRAAEGR